MASPAEQMPEKMQVSQTEQDVKGKAAKVLEIREYPLALTRNIGIMAHTWVYENANGRVEEAAANSSSDETF